MINKDVQGTFQLILSLVCIFPIFFLKGFGRYFFTVISFLLALHGLRMLISGKEKMERYILNKNQSLGIAFLLLTPVYALGAFRDFMHGENMFWITFVLFFLFLILGITYYFGPEEEES